MHTNTIGAVLITETVCLVWFPGKPVKYNGPKSYIEDEGSGRKYLTETKQVLVFARITTTRVPRE